VQKVREITKVKGYLINDREQEIRKEGNSAIIDLPKKRKAHKQNDEEV
jgi:hypothetical protein